MANKTMTIPTTKVHALECPSCGYIIYSRARHDFRWCLCEALGIDGGFDYQQVAWDDTKIKRDDIKHHTLTLPLTRVELCDDWNKRTDKFGSIAP